ncbi:MAG: hypothetical protein AAF447_22195, partial [Myxococcota bacterium]
MTRLCLAALVPLVAAVVVLPLTGCTLLGAALGGALCEGDRSCVRGFVKAGAQADIAVVEAAAEASTYIPSQFECWNEVGHTLRVEAPSREAADRWCRANGCACIGPRIAHVRRASAPQGPEAGAVRAAPKAPGAESAAR